MNLTLEIDDEVIQEARQRAEVAGTSVNQLVREFLLDYTGKNRMNEIADLFDERSRKAKEGINALVSTPSRSHSNSFSTGIAGIFLDLYAQAQRLGGRSSAQCRNSF